MIPVDLPSKILTLPETDRHTIVLITGSSGSHLAYERFALRMQQEFGSDVVAWFQHCPTNRGSAGSSRLQRIKSLAKAELRRTRARPARLLEWPGRIGRLVSERV